MKRWPKIGTRIHVEWLDITGHINAPLSEALPASCWTEGILVKNTIDYVVLASSQYRGEGDNPTGDYTCVVKGVVTKVRKI